MDTVNELIEAIRKKEEELLALRQKLAQLTGVVPAHTLRREECLQRVVALAESGQWVAAVKEFRFGVSCGLKEAHDFVRGKSIAELKNDIRRTYGIQLSDTFRENKDADKLAPIVHALRADGRVVSRCGGFEHVNSRDAETLEDARSGYTNPETEQHAVGIFEFLGLTFHLIQQTGGELTYNGIKVSATEMAQTSGSPVGLDEILNYGGVQKTLRSILEAV